MTRTNSMTKLEAGEGCARSHRAAVFVAALVASAACFSLVPGDSIGDSIVQGAMLAAVALVAVGVSSPRVLRAPRVAAARGLGAWTAYVLAVGLAGGIASFFALSQGAALDVAPIHVVQVMALCLVTGVFEEGLFRVLALDALVPALGGGRRGALRAALMSAALFGVLHVSLGEVSAAVDLAAVAQVVLKPLQAALFGLFMAAMYYRTRNLWALAVLHTAFNLLYTGPQLLSGGMQQTYVTGSLLDLVVLAATVVLLLPPACVAIRKALNRPAP